MPLSDSKIHLGDLPRYSRIAVSYALERRHISTLLLSDCVELDISDSKGSGLASTFSPFSFFSKQNNQSTFFPSLCSAVQRTGQQGLGQSLLLLAIILYTVQ